MSTGHANSAVDMLARLENMILMGMEIPLQAIRSQIAAGIDIIIHLSRFRDGSRRILEILEVAGCEGGKYCLNPLYRFQEGGQDEEGNVKGLLQKEGELMHDEKLKRAGFGREEREAGL